MRNTHRRVFERVASLSLISLCRELRIHFGHLNEDEGRAVRLWLELESYSEMVPEGCPVVLRRLFISQCRSALRVLAQVPDWSYLRVPAASPHPQLDRRSRLHLIN